MQRCKGKSRDAGSRTVLRPSAASTTWVLLSLYPLLQRAAGNKVSHAVRAHDDFMVRVSGVPNAPCPLPIVMQGRHLRAELVSLSTRRSFFCPNPHPPQPTSIMTAAGVSVEATAAVAHSICETLLDPHQNADGAAPS